MAVAARENFRLNFLSAHEKALATRFGCFKIIWKVRSLASGTVEEMITMKHKYNLWYFRLLFKRSEKVDP